MAIKNTKINVGNDPYTMITHVQLPTMVTSKYIETEEELNTLDIDNLKQDIVNGIAITSSGQDNANYSGIFENRNTSDSVELNKTAVTTSFPKTKTRKGKIHKRGAKASANKMIGLNGIKQIPLPHSGFWITLDVVPRVNRLVLEQQLAQREIELSISTATLIYSSPRAMYVSMIMDFIKEFIIDSSLSLTDNDDIMEHISVLDIDVLVLEVVKLFHTNGFKITIGCDNMLKVEDNTVKCGRSITGLVDLDYVYRFDVDYLYSDEQREILSRKQSGSVTLEEAYKYKTEYSVNRETEVYKYTVDGGDIEIKFELCSISDFITISNKFKESLELLVDDILMGDEDKQLRITKLNEVTKELLLVSYIHFISEITMNGETSIDKGIIYDTLTVFMDDPELATNIISDLVTFVDNNLISMVCTPAYTCPDCKQPVPTEEDSLPEPFQNMIPLDILNVFTELRTKEL